MPTRCTQFNPINNFGKNKILAIFTDILLSFIQNYPIIIYDSLKKYDTHFQ